MMETGSGRISVSVPLFLQAYYNYEKYSNKTLVSKEYQYFIHLYKIEIEKPEAVSAWKYFFWQRLYFCVCFVRFEAMSLSTST